MNRRHATCDECRYWEVADGGHGIYGECRRHAPALRQIKDEDVAVWPPTEMDQWCADWDPK